VQQVVSDHQSLSMKPHQPSQLASAAVSAKIANFDKQKPVPTDKLRLFSCGILQLSAHWVGFVDE